MSIRISSIVIAFILITSCSQKLVVKDQSDSKYVASQELEIETEEGIYISGSLEFATSNRLVIFISGSGPTDRDCNNNAGLKTDAFRLLASFLLERGVSSFRFDKRAVGKSTFVEESELVFDSFVSDVSAIIDYFKKDFDEIILLGHSEGALIGSIASRNKNVHSFISVAGTSKSLDQLIIDQLEKYPKLVPLAEKHINEINSGEELSEVNPLLMSLFRPSVIPYLRSVFAVDPITEVAQLQKPFLVINGKCDIQVPEEHAVELHRANENSQIFLIDNMGHVLKELNSDCSNALEAYSIPEMALNSEFKASILDFVKS